MLKRILYADSGADNAQYMLENVAFFVLVLR